MEQYILYLMFKHILGKYATGFSFSFNDIDILNNKAVGCFVRGSSISNYRDLKSGEYINIHNTVSFRVNAGLDKSAIMDGLKLCSNIKYKLTKLNNTKIDLHNLDYTIEDGEIVPCETHDGSISVFLSNCSLLSDILYLGKNTQGVSQYTINFKIKYHVMEV